MWREERRGERGEGREREREKERKGGREREQEDTREYVLYDPLPFNLNPLSGCTF